MNAEISRIRKNRGQSEIFDHKPIRVNDDSINDVMYQLNRNFSDLYVLESKGDIDIEEFVHKFIANIYIILKIFDEMGIYPDYFFDEIVKMNIEYKKVADDKSIRGDYRLFRDIKLSSRVSKGIKNGFEKGYYRLQAYPKKDINEDFLEMVGLFQTFNIPYNINTKEQCVKVFNDLKHNHTNIVDAFMNGDDIYDDIECLFRLLYEYMSFFVSMGIYPKEYLDEYIDSIKETKHK